jgi:ComF family protein
MQAAALRRQKDMPAVSATFRSTIPLVALRVRSRATALGRQFVDLVFPPRCLLCEVEERSASGVAPWCDTCEAGLLEGVGGYCPRCGAPGGGAARAHGAGVSGPDAEGPDAGCVECRDRRFRFDRVVRLGSYEGLLRDAVLRMKHPRDEPLTDAVAELFWQKRAAELSALGIDCVVPVPFHWWRRLRRGTSSPQLVASRLARRLRVPMDDRLLVRLRDTEPQGGLAAVNRRKNVRGAFAVRGRVDEFRGRRVLVVDDVLTSGATADEVARVLKRAGATWVGMAAVARTPAPQLIGAAR